MERIVELRVKGLRLVQDTRFFGFSEDSLALAKFVGERPGCRHICDLGSGNGGLTLLLWAANPEADCVGLELMPANAALAERSLRLNASVAGLAEHCRFVRGDWRTPRLYFAPQSFDLLVSNPPYQPKGAGRVSPVLERAAARSELFGGLRELLAAAEWLLAPGGRLALILPQKREGELKDSAGWRTVRRETVPGGRTLLELARQDELAR